MIYQRVEKTCGNLRRESTVDWNRRGSPQARMNLEIFIRSGVHSDQTIAEAANRASKGSSYHRDNNIRYLKEVSQFVSVQIKTKTGSEDTVADLATKLGAAYTSNPVQAEKEFIAQHVGPRIMEGRSALEMQAKHGFTHPESIACLQSYVVQKGVEDLASTAAGVSSPRVDSAWRVQLKNGGNVREVAKANGIVNPYLLTQMNRLVVNSEPTRARLLGGKEKIREIADSIGVSDAFSLGAMESLVVSKCAMKALRAGARVDEVMSMYGIATVRGKSELRSLARLELPRLISQPYARSNAFQSKQP
jgi:hypothetical protein